MLIWIPLLAVLFLGETISLKEAAGLLLAGAGTLLVQLRRPRRAASPSGMKTKEVELPL
jgi:drug/metabolite transporter (DMT)-like permease